MDCPRPDRSTIVSVSPRSADRKSTRLNSSHLGISYAVFCLKKKKKKQIHKNKHIKTKKTPKTKKKTLRNNKRHPVHTTEKKPHDTGETHKGQNRQVQTACQQ